MNSPITRAAESGPKCPPSVLRTPLNSRGIFRRYWLPALFWLATVAVFSSREFNSSNTYTFFHALLAALHIKVTAAQFFFLHAVTRKSAHFFAYAILSALFFRAFRGEALGKFNWRARWAVLALAVCMITGTADEAHQRITPGRTGNWKDTLLDMTGAVFAQLVIAARMPRFNRPQSGEPATETP